MAPMVFWKCPLAATQPMEPAGISYRVYIFDVGVWVVALQTDPYHTATSQGPFSLRPFHSLPFYFLNNINLSLPGKRLIVLAWSLKRIQSDQAIKNWPSRNMYTETRTDIDTGAIIGER